MRLVRIALASANSTVGAVASNVARMVELARAAVADGASLVVLPEQSSAATRRRTSSSGRAFVDAQWEGLAKFAEDTAELDVLLAIGLAVRDADRVFNVAALVGRGRVFGLVPKEKLPFYNVFYEERCFTRGAAHVSGALHGVPFGDLVFDTPFGTSRPRGVRGHLVAGRTDAPSLLGGRRAGGQRQRVSLPRRRAETRREMIATRAADNQATVAYCNLFGGNDGLVFDGGGLVSQNGRAILEAPRFREGFAAATVDLDRTRRLRTENTTLRHDQAADAAATAGIARVAVDVDPESARAARVPGARAQELLLARARARRAPERPRGVLRGAPRRARDSASATTSRRTARFKHDRRRPLGRPRQPLVSRGSRADGSIARCGAGGRRAKAKPRNPPRVLHAEPLLVAGDARRRGARRARARRAARRRVRSTRRSTASSPPSRRCSSPARR